MSRRVQTPGKRVALVAQFRFFAVATTGLDAHCPTGLVSQHGIDPGAQGRPALEPLDSLEHGDPGLLHDVFDDRGGKHCPREPHHAGIELRYLLRRPGRVAASCADVRWWARTVRGHCSHDASSQRSCASEGDCTGMNAASRKRLLAAEFLAYPLPPAVFASTVAAPVASSAPARRSASSSARVGTISVPTLRAVVPIVEFTSASFPVSDSTSVVNTEFTPVRESRALAIEVRARPTHSAGRKTMKDGPSVVR